MNLNQLLVLMVLSVGASSAFGLPTASECKRANGQIPGCSYELSGGTPATGGGGPGPGSGSGYTADNPGSGFYPGTVGGTLGNRVPAKPNGLMANCVNTTQIRQRISRADATAFCMRIYNP